MDQHAQVTSAGQIAYDLLSAPAEGIVYAVFQRTFYLKKTSPLISAETVGNVNGDCRTRNISPTVASPLLCCIGQAALERGPLNLCTTLRHTPDLAVGASWRSDRQQLIIDNIELNLAQTDIWLPQPGHHSLQPIQNSTDILTRFLASNAAPNLTTFRQSNRTIETIVDQQLSRSSMQLQQWLSNACDSQSYPPFPDNLLGCGEGLTPAGDDILVGTLLALRAWHKPQLGKLITAVTQRISATSEISAAHLLAACSGAGIAPLHRLIDTLSAETSEQTDLENQIIDAANNLGNYGHSSGYYAMKGVLIAASCKPNYP